jgi:drug/metabolite transporter superfamily protein YnfA
LSRTWLAAGSEVRVVTAGNGKLLAMAVLPLAALLEIAGDALIRKGMRGGGLVAIVVGFVVLGAYGLVVNQLQIDFSKLLGAYVGIFAVVSVAVGRLAFKEDVATSTWIGLAIIFAGSMVIHLGRS